MFEEQRRKVRSRLAIQTAIEIEPVKIEVITNIWSRSGKEEEARRVEREREDLSNLVGKRLRGAMVR